MGKRENAENSFGIAVDIGTTTVVAAKIAPDGTQTASTACLNSGARFGSDVMSRIRAASEGRADELQKLLQSDITGLIVQLVSEEEGAPRSIVLAGNTTMLHLLRGYDCSCLGRSPYTPVSIAAEEHTAEEMFPGISAPLARTRTILLPGISAFVGADIVSGLFATDCMRKSAGRTILFIDLGTNGEMALISGDRITVCSTAAGPVFEGAGIRDGMRGGPGAIERVVLVPVAGGMSGSEKAAPAQARCRVIGGEMPAGICGSGVLEAVSELARLRLIDRDGLLEEPWFSEGFPLAKREDDTDIRLYQEDIRAVQLAKAAIRAGMQTLLTSQGLARDAADEVLVAGAFGGALTFSRLGPLGMFPEELLSMAVAVGNTSLRGAAKVAAACLSDQDGQVLAELDRICSAAAELRLAGRQDFEALYLNALTF
ncbi:MAG: ASKHA domain-containing protein [Lachnospiraceae bacterium]|nr:ASKHA domain-containing protein [Lachnospiraceae bacterium]